MSQTSAKTAKMVNADLFLGKLDVKKSPSYGTSGRSAKGKMTVHWSSLYQVFLKKLTFTIADHTFTLCFWSRPQFFMKTHFFIWSRLRCVSPMIYPGRSGGDPGGIRVAGGGRPGGPTGKGLAGGPTGKGLAGGPTGKGIPYIDIFV